METWKVIEGYGGHYEISTEGRVRSNYGVGRILKQTWTKSYYSVHLSFKNRKKLERVHRLVAEAFLERKEGLNVVDHIDTNPRNNNVNNLRWTDTKGNANNSLTRRHKSESKKGNKNPMFGVVQSELLERIHDERKIKVRQFTKEGVFVREYSSITEAEKETSVHGTSISKACKGKRAAAGGFVWKYSPHQKN